MGQLAIKQNHTLQLNFHVTRMFTLLYSLCGYLMCSNLELIESYVGQQYLEFLLNSLYVDC